MENSVKACLVLIVGWPWEYSVILVAILSRFRSRARQPVVQMFVSEIAHAPDLIIRLLL